MRDKPKLRRQHCSSRKSVRTHASRRTREDVVRELDLAANDLDAKANPLAEQLKQCPEAFKVGELLGKALDSLKYHRDEAAQAPRCLAPAGAVLPPIV